MTCFMAGMARKRADWRSGQADIFVFDAATIATNVDRIVDFNAAQDRI